MKAKKVVKKAEKQVETLRKDIIKSEFEKPKESSIRYH